MIDLYGIRNIISDDLPLVLEGEKTKVSAKIDETNPLAIPIKKTEEDSYYQNYIQFGFPIMLSSDVLEQLVTVSFFYSNRLSNIEAKYSRIGYLDEISNQWILVDTVHNVEDKVLIATVPKVCKIGIFVNTYWYSPYTQSIANQYPTWTYIRQSNESNGQRFFNFFAMALEQIHEEGLEIQQEKFIDQINVQMLDWVFVYELPSIKQSDTVFIYDGYDPKTRKTVSVLDTLREFFYSESNDCAIIDYDHKKLYTRKQYSNLNGTVNGQLFSSDGLPFQIWNPFDEFGLLVGVKRLYREPNISFKERIKDVFRYPANSGERGLINGVARELNMIKRVTWKDDSKNLYLKGIGIDPLSILVDDKPLQFNEYRIDEYQNIIIEAMNQGVEHTVSFIQYVEKYELHDKSNEDLYTLMFEEDGQASPLLKKWVSYINQVAPVMWGAFNWDEGFWDTISKELTGLGFVPNIWDSSIDIWKNYMFNPKRWEEVKIWQS